MLIRQFRKIDSYSWVKLFLTAIAVVVAIGFTRNQSPIEVVLFLILFLVLGSLANIVFRERWAFKSTNFRYFVFAVFTLLWSTSHEGYELEQMKIKLDSIKIDTPIVPIVSNVSAEAISDPDTIKKLLVSQVTGSVRWRESILWMAANDVDEIWEVGSGKALSGMIRRIDKDISLKNFSSAEDIKSAVF